MEVPSMANTKRNIESNKENPEQANQLFSELRLNDVTIADIKEGRCIALDNRVKQSIYLFMSKKYPRMFRKGFCSFGGFSLK
jgi:hypothetical protein